MLSLLATVVVILGTQRGAWGFRDAMGMLRWVVQIGLVLMLLNTVIFGMATKQRQPTAQLRSGAAIALLLIPVAGILTNQVTPPVGPPINDITTDTLNPPAFVAVVSLRPEGSNPVDYGGAAVAARQAELYPDIQPIDSTLSAPESFQRALETAQTMGWEIVASDSQLGVIEAVDTTRFFRFKDDIVIRVASAGGGSRIDIRSRSRLGRSDLGKNAARIRRYIELFSARRD